MSLQERLRDDLKQSLKKGARVRVAIIRLVLAAIANAEIEKQSSLNDAMVLGLIAREVRRHHESIEAFRKGNRQDLVSKEEAELAVLQEYLPRQMSREEIVATARQVIDEVGARGPGDKGKVMSRLMPQLKGKTEGREVNDIVSELLISLSPG